VVPQPLSSLCCTLEVHLAVLSGYRLVTEQQGMVSPWRETPVFTGKWHAQGCDVISTAALRTLMQSELRLANQTGVHLAWLGLQAANAGAHSGHCTVVQLHSGTGVNTHKRMSALLVVL
jgi:hypothetical protein